MNVADFMRSVGVVPVVCEVCAVASENKNIATNEARAPLSVVWEQAAQSGRLQVGDDGDATQEPRSRVVWLCRMHYDRTLVRGAWKEWRRWAQLGVVLLADDPAV